MLVMSEDAGKAIGWIASLPGNEISSACPLASLSRRITFLAFCLGQITSLCVKIGELQFFPHGRPGILGLRGLLMSQNKRQHRLILWG
jgi:hypothetical protein